MGAYTPLLPFDRWYLASSPVIPEFYWDVVSAEQRWKEICCHVHRLAEYATDLNQNQELFKSELDALKAEFEEFKATGFYDYYAEQIDQWIQDHMESIIRDAVKMLFFGLTDDGYFCAYIPASWDDIEFDTGAVYGADDYGRLILEY